MEPVRLNHITHQIDGRAILREISIAFSDKKVTAIIGKSGSGKSTLLKTVNGLVKPSSGSVEVFGEDIDYKNLSNLRKKIGYVVQGVGLFPHLTVAENILLAGKAHLPKNEIDDAHLHTLMNLVNLSEHLYKKYPHELSGGEQQRVGICRALFLNPAVLLMDEPFGALDPITRFDIHKEFIRLQQSAPRTVLIVTHDMREAKKIADEILVIDQGVIQQFDVAREIFTHPATPVVEELLMMAEV